MSNAPLSEDDLHNLYLWVDDIPLTRPKRNISRDFADGVCVAEIMKHFFPSIVEIHNFVPANSSRQKVDNWETLNNKVFRKLRFDVSPDEIRDITTAVPGAVERFLKGLQTKIAQIKQKQAQRPASSSSGGFAGGGAAAAEMSKQRGDGYPAAHSTGGRQYQPQPQPSGHSHGGNPKVNHRLEDLLHEKDDTIQELREAVAILTQKVGKLEEIIAIKDHKIATYEQRLSGVHRAPPR